MTEPILKVRNLNVELGGEKVLEDLDFDLNEKEILIILGPNGAGKSVLLRTLLGLHQFQGQIQWKKNIHIGYVPEGFNISPDLPLSVKEFFQFKKASLQEMSQTLRWIGVEDFSKFLEKRLGALSTGQLRRVIIAWALIDKPDVLLLDEPMLGVDIHGRETIYDTLVKLWQKQNQAIILVSHEIGEVVKRGDKILALNKRKLFYGKPEKVVTARNLAKIYGGAISL
jgi:zinc transport system ATP-binding protein